MSNKTWTLYEFDEFRVDAARKCLWHADELVSLTPKAFETLLVLIRHRGEIVSKDALLGEVWADTFVEESTLSQNILTLRKTLGTFEKDKQFIVTVPRRGFRFVAEVKEIAADEEVFVVEKRTRVVAEEIHDSRDAAKPEAAIAAKPVRRKPRAAKYKVFGLLCGALAILTIAFFGRHYFSPSNFAAAKFQKFRIGNLFSDAEIRSAIISPDGKYLALVKKSGATESLIVRQIAEANSLEIVSNFDGRIAGASFAPASDYLYYTVYAAGSRIGELYKIPILGGAPQAIAKNVDGAAAISADSKKIAFVRRYPNEKETALVIADADGQNERRLAVRAFGEGFQTAAFAPDGKFVSSAVYSGNPAKPMEIMLVDTESGAQRSLTPRGWTWIGQTAWLKDGSGVAFVAFSKETPDLADEVWFVSFPEGNARLLENGVNGVFGVSLTDDANSLVTVKSDKITTFAVSPLADLTRSATLLTKNGDASLLPLGADWTPDDSKIVYSTVNNGNADLWIMNADGGGQRQLTTNPQADASPKISPDGKFIYFLSNRSGLMSVWRMNADGTNPQKITENQDVFALELAPDGSEIFYTARAENIYVQKLWKISTDGKNARQLTETAVFLPNIAPDGKTLACYASAPESRSLKLTLLSTETGAALRQIETPPAEGLALFDWNRDGRSLYLTTRENGVATLWLQSTDGKPATKLKDWQNEGFFRLNVSNDGKRLFYEKGIATNSVLLFNNNVSDED
ncbi:MAG TPA: winged helix-turn-helix domain-containing protein [Pyrinomonadaceae bacterium]|jgi:Tol biopolymer transport system component/DNA-binding winged helix-turn-helix (wHTH) protein